MMLGDRESPARLQRASPALRAARLLTDVLSRKRPPRALVYVVLSKLSYVTRSLRYDFERLYLGNRDPWAYLTSGYEQRKHRQVLARIIEHRPGAHSVLEIGCSIGVFSGMLAEAFVEVTAVDLSAEAIALARRTAAGRTNVTFLRGDVRSLRLRSRFDVIVCAEVLYFLPRRSAVAVTRVLRRHLGPDGILVTVSGRSRDRPEGRLYFYDWRSLLADAPFDVRLEETVDDPERPYEVTIYAQRDAGRHEA